MQRVRRIVTRSGGGYRGKFPSRKLGRMVHYQSLLERDAILHLEYHPAVVDYQEQPSRETYYDADQNARFYFPDFLAILVTSMAINIEAKPHAKTLSPKTHDKLACVALRMSEQQRVFRVWTEHHIRREPLYSNLRRLHEARAQNTNPLRLEMLLKVARAEAPSFAYEELVKRFGTPSAVLGLLARGVLRANLEQPLTSSTRIWTQWNPEDIDGAFLL